ncbi:MAG TPA: PIN domain-containing protein [Candidatus Deferrimicrobiaceae bacterium]|nr:PIN domain-containing protein [Candidatus Deferrimicrobiaceae bacterium]
MLVDTSVWVDHFRRRNAALAERLNRGEVRSHPFVTGELSCGNLRRRKEILSLLTALPRAAVAGHEEALAFVEANRLMGRGIGWVDVHLLASARLTGIPLWTLDRRLREVAGSLGLGPGA